MRKRAKTFMPSPRAIRPSQYKEGGNSFPGFLNSDAGAHSRKNYAGYIDLALAPIEALQLDLAGRAEHYTDFGDTQIGKFTARYDFSPQFAVRGTIATGFRAPTIAEEFYTATNVSPTTVDRAAAGRLGCRQGFGPQQPEARNLDQLQRRYRGPSVRGHVGHGRRVLAPRSATASFRSATVLSAGPPGSVTSPLVAAGDRRIRQDHSIRP